MEVITCIACLKEKPLSSFGKDKNRKLGYVTRCRTCVSKGLLKYKPIGEKMSGDDLMLKLNKITKDDYYNSFIMLKTMGYDIKNDIHHQFCLKYGLKPKEKYEHKDVNYYSKEDLF
jgi:hypothetical protein